MNRLTEVSAKSGYRATCNHYRKLAYPLFLTLLVLLLTSPAQAKYNGGTGEPNNPYRISDTNDMNEIGTHSEDWGSHFLLVNDINLAEYTGTQFNIIGNDSNAFTGVFDGNDLTISNFTYDSNGIDDIGLFGYVGDGNGVIKNLTLRDPNVYASFCNNVGALAGYVEEAKISNCTVIGGSIIGNNNVGGFAGVYHISYMVDCYATGTVTGNHTVGGLVGEKYEGAVLNCKAFGNVNGSDWVGGLLGINFTGIVSNCEASGTVTGNNTVGGLAGINRSDIISGSRFSGTVIGNSDVGGLVGFSTVGTITNCYATGTVDGNDSTGGLVGVMGDSDISDCYATGTVDGSDSTGGLVGSMQGQPGIGSWLKNCYAAGVVTGDTPNTGGLVGYNTSFTWYAKCFWDNDINPDVNGIGNTTDPNVIGKSTAEMQTESTFTDAGWDFVGEVINGPNDIWRMCVDDVNYPLLSWQFNEVDFTCPDGVDLLDFSVLALAWGSEQGNGNWNKACDISDPNDDVINIKDLKIFTDNWLAGVE